MRRPVPLAVVLLLAVSLLAACTSHGTTSQVQSQGQASSVGPPPTAALPAGEQATVHVATVPDASGPSNELLWGDEKQVGPAYDFTVAKEPSSALIAFSVDPSKLPASVGVPDATPAGLYIQAFEPSLGSWIPLRSSYDTKTRAVTATAPHLSTFSLAWTAIKCAVTCPAALFAKVVKRFTADVVANVKEAWSPRQEDDECASEADTNWAVRSSISKLSGCVIDGSPPVMQEENPLLLPMRVRQPQGAPHAALAQQPYMADGHPELTSLVAGIIDWAANATLLAPRGYGVVPLTALPESGTQTLLTQPDTLGLVMDVIDSLLFALPAEKTEDEAIGNAVKEVLPEFEAKMTANPGSVSLTDILDAVEENVAKQQAGAPGPVLTFVKALNGAYECASDDLAKDVNNGATDGGISNGVLEGAGNLAKKCVDTALQALGKEESHSLSDVLDIIDAIPNFGKTVRESVQFAELGPSAMTGTTTIAGEQFQAFGLTMDNFAWSAGNGQVAITPPLGADEYSALWGVTDGQSRCDVTVNMDSRLDDPDATGNFGFAVAPLSEVQSDQPAGASVQYEHEAPPDFAVAGSFLRPAFLPGGAWQVEVTPVPAPDIYLPRHIQVTDNGDAMTVEIDGQRLATYTHQPECGGVGIRVWGAGFTFTNVRITSS